MALKIFFFKEVAHLPQCCTMSFSHMLCITAFQLIGSLRPQVLSRTKCCEWVTCLDFSVVVVIFKYEAVQNVVWSKDCC